MTAMHMPGIKVPGKMCIALLVMSWLAAPSHDQGRHAHFPRDPDVNNSHCWHSWSRAVQQHQPAATPLHVACCLREAADRRQAGSGLQGPTSSAKVFFSTWSTRSTMDTLGVGTRRAMPAQDPICQACDLGQAVLDAAPLKRSCKFSCGRQPHGQAGMSTQGLQQGRAQVSPDAAQHA